MDYFCDVCDKTYKKKSKSNNRQSLRHIDFEKSIRIKHVIQNPDFFDIDEIFNEYITKHNEKFE